MSCKRANNSARSDTRTAASDQAAADIEKTKHVWTKFNPEVFATQRSACSHFDTQCGKGSRPKTFKAGAPKTEIDNVRQQT